MPQRFCRGSAEVPQRCRRGSVELTKCSMAVSQVLHMRLQRYLSHCPLFSFIMGRSDLSDGSAKLVGFRNALNNIRTKLKHSHVLMHIYFFWPDRFCWACGLHDVIPCVEISLNCKTVVAPILNISQVRNRSQAHEHLLFMGPSRQ